VFSDDEFKRRLSTLQEELDRSGIGAAVCTSVHNILYFSGFFYVMPYGRYAAVVIPQQGEPTIVTPRIEEGRVRDFTWFNDIRVYTDSENTVEGTVRLCKEVLQERGLAEGTIGLEEDSTPHVLWDTFGRALPKAKVVDPIPSSG
ncbi:MAG: aminopeptidase P family N-terminal domain-containing protein, partial [Dehalococcoidia bacterium]